MNITGIIAGSNIYRHRIIPDTTVYDSDALTFINAASIVDLTQKTAINTLVSALKTASIWTKLKALYPMVGGNATAHAVNLKSPGTFNLTFVASPTHSATGVDWDGTTQYAQTGLVPNTSLSKDAKAYGYYSRENTAFAAPGQGEIGTVGTGGGTTFDGIFIRATGDLFTGYLSDITGATNSNANSQGFYIISRSNSTQINLYKNGAAAGTNPRNVTSAATQSTDQIEIGRTNAQYTDRQCALAFISDDLSSTNVSDFYTAVQAFQTSLNRQI